MKCVACVLTLIAVATALVGCGSASQSDANEALRQVFSDFSYVRRQPVADDFKSGFPPSGTTALPETFEPGYRYIFHRRLPSDNVQLGTKVLPERLKSQGFDVLEFPKTERELVYSYIGGPFFRIRFRSGDRVGLIFNANDLVIGQDDAHRRLWMPDDYILELQP